MDPGELNGEDGAYLYPDEQYTSWKEKMRRKGDLNPAAVFFIMTASFYVMYVSFGPIIDYFTNGIDFWGLIFYTILFTVGAGGLFGGLAMARHSIIYGRLLDSTFEKEIYSRLEPALRPQRRWTLYWPGGRSTRNALARSLKTVSQVISLV